MGLSESEARQLIGLSYGRRLNWKSMAPVTAAAPSTYPANDDGVDVRDAIVGRLSIQLREDMSAQAAEVSIDTSVDDTYTITVDGTDYDYVASGKTAAQIATALKALLAAATSIVVTDNLDGTLSIVGATEAAYTIAASTLATGAITVDAEASYAEWQFCFRNADLPTGYDAWDRYTFPDGSTSKTFANNGSENVDLTCMREAFIHIVDHDAQGTKAIRRLIGVGERDNGAFDYV